MASSDAAPVKTASEAIQTKIREHAIDQAIEYAAERFAPAIGAFGPIVSMVTTLGELYDRGIEGPRQEGDIQRSLGASDAGVVSLAQSLNFSAAFKANVVDAHAGSSNVAAAMTATIREDAGLRTELQFRADQGLVDTAGYAQLAAKEMAPLLGQARSAAPSDASKLLLAAAEIRQKYLAPVLARAHGDAAYGLGVQYAVFLATRAVGSPQGQAQLERAFQAANANILSIMPPVVIHG